ncbi:hypothetical protein [Tessaracoccus sp.]
MSDDQQPRVRALDPAVAHHIDARTIMSLTSYLDSADLPEIRMLLARRIQIGSRRGARFTTWQEAWNDLTGATENRGGILSYTPPRCKTCHGRRFVTRTGSVCHACMGRGKPTRPERVTARYAPPPQSPPTSPEG